MTVRHVGFKPKRSGEVKAEKHALLYETIGRRYSVEMFATCDAIIGPKLVLSSPLVPQVGQAYNFGLEADNIATVVSVKCDATDSPFIWDLSVDYDTSRVISAVTDNPLRWC